MNPPHSSISHSHSSDRGSALIITLAALALLLGLVIVFFMSVTSNRLTSVQYANSVSLRQLADTASNLVVSQIRQGASGQNGEIVWASQPGAVRTYDVSGTPQRIYKLYSASSMVVPAAAFSPAQETTALANWKTRTAFYTDLNEPALVRDPLGGIVADGNTFSAIYPILDPSAAGGKFVSDSYKGGILPDPASTTPGVEGFFLNPLTNVVNYSGTYPPASDYNPVKNPNPAPMPAQWLYILQDGSIVSPSGPTGTQATLPNASPSNPVVARIAFWTDDETSKVNLNTAGEGKFWDSPRWVVRQALEPGQDSEQAFAYFQPAAGEYNRYPGHPATTSLSAVFPNLVSSNWQNLAVNDILTSLGEDILPMTPRLQFAGSKMGTTTSSTAIDPTQKLDRLYSTIDELRLKADRTENPVLTRADIQRARFFITTHSRAPETTAFNQPRIAMWPIYAADPASSSPYHTALDRLIAFCSTINGKPYYFQREDARSSTHDFSNLTRNRELFAWLQNRMDQPIPGYGGTFNDKYGALGTSQILTSIFDYIRSCINLADPQLDPAYRYARALPGNSKSAGLGEVVPISIQASGQELKGFGRFPVLTEAALWFVAVGQGKNTLAPAGNFQDAALPVNPQQPFRSVPAGGLTPPDNTTAVLALLVCNFATPAHGWSPYRPAFTFRVKGLDQFKLNGQPMGFPNAGSVFCQDSVFFNAVPWGGPLGLWASLAAKNLDSTGPDRYPLYSNILYLPNRDPVTHNPLEMAFSGGPIEIEIFAGDQSANPLQTYTLNLPAANHFPIPTIPVKRNANGTLLNQWDDRALLVGSSAVNSSADRLDQAAVDPATQGLTDTLIRPGDVVKGYALANGDLRHLFRPLVDDSFFAAPDTWDTSGISFSHSLAAPEGRDNHLGLKKGNLVYNLDLTGTIGDASANGGNTSRNPLLPARVNGVVLPGENPASTTALRGDFDNGYARWMDGPYINKADEGNSVNFGDPSKIGKFYYSDTYFSSDYAALNPGQFSANRQVSSPVILGSLPTGMQHNPPRPWQTLLFHPAPTSPTAASGHPGQAGRKGDGTLLAGAPPDHSFLDFFWMPVVEPYAISEPFSTAGKINLNAQIVPYSGFLVRNTALHALLKSERVAMVMDTNYKGAGANGASRMRVPILISTLMGGVTVERGALRQIKERFDAGKLFLSASEICEIFLTQQAYGNDTNMRNFFNGINHRFTGDNTIERVYADIYPRITTKSNTFLVHFRTQLLKKAPGSSAAVWDENRDTVTAESRGSSLIERYLDPNDPDIPDFTQPANYSSSLESYYRYRILNTREFKP